MYTTILVPLDGSKRSEAILPHVEQLAQHYKAKTIFLQVVPFRTFPGGEAGPGDLFLRAFEQDSKAAESYLSVLEDAFRKKEIRAVKYIAQGPVVETIINVAEKEKVDLVAIASHGRTGLSRVFYGSVASGLLHSIDRPLLLIRSRYYEE